MSQPAKPVVLLVDDHLEFRAIQSAYLGAHGYRVLTAGDGETALETARAQLPSIIVLDHSLPRRNGLDIARELKADSATRDIPILMLTAHTYGAVGHKARQAGCAAYIAKPCEPRRVLEEVARHTA